MVTGGGGGRGGRWGRAGRVMGGGVDGGSEVGRDGLYWYLFKGTCIYYSYIF